MTISIHIYVCIYISYLSIRSHCYQVIRAISESPTKRNRPYVTLSTEVRTRNSWIGGESERMTVGVLLGRAKGRCAAER